MGRRGALIMALGCLVGCKQLLGLDDFDDKGSSASTNAATGSGGGGVGGSGGGSPTARCGGFSALADDFQDDSLLATVDRPGWQTYLENATAFEGLGVMVTRLAPVGNSAFGQVAPAHWASLIGEAVTVRVKNITTTPTTMTRMWLDYDGNNHISFEARVGEDLRAMMFVAGTATVVGHKPYNPIDHAYWRFEESGGQVRWRTSSDGSNWNDLAATGTETLPFNRGLLRLKLDATSTSPDNTADEAHFDDLNDVMRVEPWCPASTFTDDFDDGVLGDAWFRTDLAPGCVVTETNGELQLGWSDTTAGNCHLGSSTAFNLENSHVLVRVKHIDVAPSLTVYLRVHFGIGQYIDIRQSRVGTTDQVRAIAYDDGIENQLASKTYSPTQHEWWRLREEEGTTYWETSPDGMAWEELARAPNSMPMTAVDVGLGVGTNLIEGTAVFSNLNSAP